jgi:hypothetical protein
MDGIKFLDLIEFQKQIMKLRKVNGRTEWVDNIKMDLREIGWDGKDWIDLAQDRARWRAYVNAMMNLRVP